MYGYYPTEAPPLGAYTCPPAQGVALVALEHTTIKATKWDKII